MKTVIEHYDNLPPGYRERAIKRAKEQNLENIKCSYFLFAIYKINWSKTKEGANFWGDVYNWALDKSYPLPILKNEEPF